MNVKTCWEYHDCPAKVRADCPAGKAGHGHDCWYFAGSFRRDAAGYCEQVHGRVCTTCPYYEYAERSARPKGNDWV